MEFDQTILSVDLDILEQNITQMRNCCGNQIMAVVKADAYGHGAVPVARALEPLCAFFGVSSVMEAMELYNIDMAVVSNAAVEFDCDLSPVPMEKQISQEDSFRSAIAFAIAEFSLS